MPNGIASGLDPRHGNLGTWSSAFRLPVVQVLEFLAKEETAARKVMLASWKRTAGSAAASTCFMLHELEVLSAFCHV